MADHAQIRTARYAVYASFTGAGLSFASWAARIPQIRDSLRVSPGALGLILLAGATGAVIATPLSGLVISWLGEIRTVAVMSLVSAAGLAVIAVGYSRGPIPVAAGLLLTGYGGGTWDVAMNVQGTVVEQALGRAIMPRFHAAWSIGTVAGAGVGAAMVALGVPVAAHLLAVAAVIAATMPASARGFLRPAGAAPAPGGGHGSGRPGGSAGRRHPFHAWAEPRTVLIGVFVLCVTVSEGTGNDWLSLAVIDGYHTPAVVGTATFAVFLAAMTAGRWFGPRFIDRYGRVASLRACAATALAGVLLAGLAPSWPAAMAGAAAMGLGTSLGFPVGLSAAADDPRYAPGRVSTAAAIGYLAFLAGPPVIGFLADHVGVHHSLLAAGLVLTAAFFLAPATAPLPQAGEPADAGV
jgi:predicted MFS family arabinose efflux permease